MDDHSKSQVKRLVAQSPEYAAGYKAGREAGMREAAKIAEKEEEAFMADSGSKDLNDHYAACASGAGSAAVAILSAIGGGK